MKHLLLTTIGAVLLVGCGTTTAMLIHKAAFDGNIKAVKRHLDAGVDANVQTRSENTPLHAAVDQGHAAVAELLIVKGADLNARMKGGGYTVLDLANLKEQTETAVLLRKHGAKTGEELKAEGK